MSACWRAKSRRCRRAAAPARRESVLAGRVLLVEDEEAVLEFERDVLVGAGAEVTTSMSVEDTQQRLRNGSFDVIVMNGRMPGGCSARGNVRVDREELPRSGERAAADVFYCDRPADPKFPSGTRRAVAGQAV